MSDTGADIINLLAGIEAGSRLDAIRAQRSEARENAQKSYLALFAPTSHSGVSGAERYALAAFVAGLHQDVAIFAFYRDGLDKQDARPDLSAAIEDESARGSANGPYGRYPAGLLSVEDKSGPIYRIAGANLARLGARLSAAFEHAHLLIFHPRDASPAALQALLNVGWSSTEIVTLSQLIAFLSFQIRVIVGLRALQASDAARNSNL
jgi:CMD domain protein